MRIIATLLNPTWGEAYVCGNSIYTKPKEIRRLVGYMPDFFGVYDDMTVATGFLKFAPAQPARGAMFSARSRARRGGESPLAAPVSEADFSRGPS